MFVVGDGPKYDAVVIKATLKGGKYPNEWLEPHQRLKYYLKSRKGVFSENYIENSAIRNNPEIPIYAFVRDTEIEDFTFEGVFYYFNVQSESDGSKWFDLTKRTDQAVLGLIKNDFLETQLQQKIIRSQKSGSEERKKRLATTAKKPRSVTILTTGFIRNADVIVEVLIRANGVCEGCNNPAPFIRKKDGTPYLEVHHKIPLADEGEDTVENAVAYCPNCHRKAHHG